MSRGRRVSLLSRALDLEWEAEVVSSLSDGDEEVSTLLRAALWEYCTTRKDIRLLERQLKEDRQLPISWSVEVADEFEGWFTAKAIWFDDRKRQVTVQVYEGKEMTYEGSVPLDCRVVRLVECHDIHSQALFNAAIWDSIQPVRWDVLWKSEIQPCVSSSSMPNLSSSSSPPKKSVPNSPIITHQPMLSLYSKNSPDTFQSNSPYTMNFLVTTPPIVSPQPNSTWENTWDNFPSAPPLTFTEQYTNNIEPPPVPMETVSPIIPPLMSPFVSENGVNMSQESMEVEELPTNGWKRGISHYFIAMRHSLLVEIAGGRRAMYSPRPIQELQIVVVNNRLQLDYCSLISTMNLFERLVFEERVKTTQQARKQIRNYLHQQKQGKTLSNEISPRPVSFSKPASVSMEKHTCVVCLDRHITNVAFIPCGHQILCAECLTLSGNTDSTCLLCRSPITSRLTIFTP